MKYDFDEIRDRSNTAKWARASACGAIGMGIADMDFRLLPEVIDAVKACADEGEFGYTVMSGKDYDAVTDWLKYRGYDVPREHIICTPGVLYTARTAMHALTQPGDKVIVSPPLHTPSIATASMLGREALVNKMILKDGEYFLDLDHLEKCFRDGARVLMMCAPNNPTGRVWTLDELKSVAELINKYDAYIVCDEIHRDIIWDGYRHISPTELPELAERTVSAFSTSKTFNMGGFHIGSAIIPNEELRKRVVDRFYSYGHPCARPSTLDRAAQTAAYSLGREWYEEMMQYVRKNIDLALDCLSDLPIHAKSPQGTFLLWIDVSEMNKTTLQLQEIMVNHWKVICDRGILYDTHEYIGKNPHEHHIRMNMATPRANVEEAFTRIRKYFKIL
ncbi:MAG: aminotransferase class I/II-fold pyridoxal phosphate-dependent enzyme [Ruminococcaceae bacterium]|nr:aminotransferase class I/II-fold pyridoxal phosphate-dependent enzyme [Oscillospiraceae bacterium]